MSEIVSKREWLFVWIIAITIMVATTLPYFIGYGTEQETHTFSGFVIGVEDGNSYIAKMLSGWAGSWAFQSPYTAFPQRDLLIFLPYILLGKLASPPALHEQLVGLFHMFRLGAGIALILASYSMIARYITDRRIRYLAVLLINLGGGLGWLILFSGESEWLGSLPLEFHSPEAFGFLSLFGLPHLAMARAFMLWSLLAYLELFDRAKNPSNRQSEIRSPRHSSIRLSIFWIIAGIFNPLELVIIGAVIIIHVCGTFLFEKIMNSRKVLSWKAILIPLLAAGFVPLCYLIYYFFISIWDPFASQWTKQNQILSPNILHYLLAYGLLIPYAWIGAARLMRIEFTRGWLLAGWVLVLPIMVYAPFGLQRRLAEGVWVAICILAAAGLDQPSAEPPNPQSRLLNWKALPIVFVFLSTFILFTGGIIAAQKPSPPIFLPVDQTRLFETLQINSKPKEVVLASYSTGNALPAWAPVHVLVGHGPESIHSAELMPEIKAFFHENTDNAYRIDLINRFEIDYVIWGPSERAYGDWNPQSSSFLEAIASEGEYYLFGVHRDNP